MFDIHAYENVADFMKALGHEHRLLLLDLLSTKERCVEELANLTAIGVKSVSAHLRVMRTQGLVTTRKEGLRVYYRLRNNDILTLFQRVWQVALECKDITPLTDKPQFCLTLKELLAALADPNTLLIDVRDTEDFNAGHIANAQSIPVDDFALWAKTYQDISRPIVVYCEGYYCIEALRATTILQEKGCLVKMYRNGINEWQAAGFEVVQAAS